jgi:transcriptional regulator with XRE-family HTH domain
MDEHGILLKHFLAWQEREHERKTLRQFADLIGISPQQLNHFWNGKRKFTPEVSEKLYTLFGDEEFYKVAGLPIPDHRKRFIDSNWEKFTEEQKNKAMEILAEYRVGTKK